MIISRDQWHREELELLHPNLRKTPWDIKSCRTPDYNCIAFVLGILSQRWQPDPLFGDYWPDDIPRNNTEDTWLTLFARYGGYERCNDGNCEAGFEKITIYADANSPMHVAKQVTQGIWHSKMGGLEDIHHDLHALNPDRYGVPRYFLKRKKGEKKPTRKALKRVRKRGVTLGAVVSSRVNQTA